MAFGQIYCSSWWGDNKNKQTVPQFSTLDCSNSPYESFYSFYFDGQAPAEVLANGSSSTYFEPTPTTGFTITAFIKPDSSLATGSYNQKCIVDLSSDISSTANGTGYSLYMRKTSTSFPKVSFFVKGIGQTQSLCRIDVDLNPATFGVLDQTYCVIATWTPGPNSDFTQRLYVSNAAGVVINTTKVRTLSPVSIPYPAQSFCVGNTNQFPTIASEFFGNIDEVTFSNGGWSNSSISRLQNAFNDANDLDVNSYIGANLVIWWRMGENATFSQNTGLPYGPGWLILNQSNATAGANAESYTLAENDRVAGII